MSADKPRPLLENSLLYTRFRSKLCKNILNCILNIFVATCEAIENNSPIILYVWSPSPKQGSRLCGHPQILADQLTHSQPGGRYAHQIILAPPDFQTFLRPFNVRELPKYIWYRQDFWEPVPARMEVLTTKKWQRFCDNFLIRLFR